MKKTILLIIALAAMCAIYAQGFTISTPEGNLSMSITGVQPDGNTKSGVIIDNIVARLEKLDKDFVTKLSKLDQKRAQNIIEEIYGLLAQLPYDANVTLTTASSATTTTSTTTTTTQPNININVSGNLVDERPVTQSKPKVQEKSKPQGQLVAPASNRTLISDTAFKELVGRIGKESFSDDKLRVLRTAARNNKFNTNQISQLMKIYTYSSDKLEALRIAYPEVQDPQNNFRILDALTFSSDKEEAEQIMNSN